MNKWLKRLSPISLPPTDRKELIPWLLFKLLYWLVGPIGLLMIGGVFLATTFLAFALGDYNGSGNGTYSSATGGVTMTQKEQAINDNLHYNATKVAATWEKGLTSDEIQAVQQANLDVPPSVLLAIGKIVDNVKSGTVATFRNYYDYFQPIDFTFIHKTDVKITYRSVWVPPHRSCGVNAKGKRSCSTTPGYWTCRVNETDTPVTLITYANTWNGTYSADYRDVISGTKGCGGHGSTREWSSEWTAYNVQHTYTWTKLWNLFHHIKTVTGWYVKDSYDRDFLSGLMAMSDPSIDDPYVQNMVAQLTFLSAGSIAPITGVTGFNPPPASPDVVKNVLAYQAYIDYFASAYQIPPALLAGQMAQESGGTATTVNGQVTMSSAGALGLMQVLPTTAQGLTIILPTTGQTEYVGNHWYALLANPITNISIGADYISNLYKEFGGNITETLAAYNAGPGAEDQALVGINAVTVDGVAIPNYGQTIAYVQDIENSWMPQLAPYFSSQP